MINHLLDGKVCLISGGNAGIGLWTCIGLAKRGARVILMARNEKKAIDAQRIIMEKSGSNKIDYLIADFSSFDSIRKAAAQFKRNHNRLDVLINNAAAFFTDYKETMDGFERQWQINHLSHFLLTNLLFDRLASSPSARVINVSSKAQSSGNFDFDDLNRKHRYNGLAAYSQTKLANVVFANEFSRRFANKKITANSLHPGVINTDIGNKNTNGVIGLLWRFGKPFMKTPQKGAETSIYLATSPDLEGIYGEYFENCVERSANPLASDKEIGSKLWKISEESVGLV